MEVTHFWCSENALIHLYIAAASSDSCSVVKILVTNIYYCCRLVKCLFLFKFEVRLFVRKKVYCLAKIGHVVILWEVPRILLFPL